MTIYKTLLGTALLVVIALPAFAQDGKKTKEITEVVGYNVTETTTYEGPRANFYKKMDRDGSGGVDFKEYQRVASVDNEYAMFMRLDRNGDKSISVEEFVNADVTKGNTNIASEMFGKVQGTNLKTRKLPEVKSYYLPIEPEIVEIKDIAAPAAE